MERQRDENNAKARLKQYKEKMETNEKHDNENNDKTRRWEHGRSNKPENNMKTKDNKQKRLKTKDKNKRQKHKAKNMKKQEVPPFVVRFYAIFVLD